MKERKIEGREEGSKERKRKKEGNNER